MDLDITVKGGGVSAQAGAVRYALSMCLRSFVEKSVVDDMKINGLLTQVIFYKYIDNLIIVLRGILISSFLLYSKNFFFHFS